MDVLSAPYVLEYTYQRSTGPVIGRFLTALRDGRLEGVRTATGRVLMPPLEYDPATGEATGEPVPLPPDGVVTTWAWVATPRPGHPLDRPFAWALIRIDGADTAMLHAVDAGAADAMRTGMRVTARWRAERTGSILDLACFVPVAPEAP
ncbi:MAG: OB-fold domain-containing protein [Myxococcales bacterium]|nr:OB-fold domain-containing protein [Myxococcales bacterium]